MGRARVREALAKVVGVAALVAAGCASFPQPYTAAELRADSESRAGEALVHYLSQPNADAAVCDPEAGVLRRFDGDDFGKLLDGLDDEDVPARLWASCAQRLLVGMSADSSRAANVGMAELFIDCIDATDGDGAQLAVLQALLLVLETRPARATALRGDSPWGASLSKPLLIAEPDGS